MLALSSQAYQAALLRWISSRACLRSALQISHKSALHHLCKQVHLCYDKLACTTPGCRLALKSEQNPFAIRGDRVAPAMTQSATCRCTLGRATMLPAGKVRGIKSGLFLESLCRLWVAIWVVINECRRPHPRSPGGGRAWAHARAGGASRSARQRLQRRPHRPRWACQSHQIAPRALSASRHWSARPGTSPCTYHHDLHSI